MSTKPYRPRTCAWISFISVTPSVVDKGLWTMLFGGKLRQLRCVLRRWLKICHSLLKSRGGVSGSRNGFWWWQDRISFCQTCYAKAPTKDLASQIAYLYLFVADHEVEEHDRFVSLALKMFEAADEAMCAFLRRDVSLLSWSGEKCSKEESDDRKWFWVSLLASVLCVSKNCAVQYREQKEARCPRISHAPCFEILDLSVSPTGQIDEIEVQVSLHFHIQDDFLKEVPEIFSWDACSESPSCFFAVAASAFASRNSRKIKSFRVHFSSHSSGTCLFEGIVSLVMNPIVHHCYEIHYDEKQLVIVHRHSSFDEKIQEGMPAFSMAPLNALSFHNVPRVSILKCFESSSGDFSEVAYGSGEVGSQTGEEQADESHLLWQFCAILLHVNALLRKKKHKTHTFFEKQGQQRQYTQHISLLLALLGALVGERLVNMRNHTTTSNGCLDEVSGSSSPRIIELKMTRSDTLDFQVLGSISGELENLGGQVLHDGCGAGSGSSNPLLHGNTLFQVSVHTTNGELF